MYKALFVYFLCLVFLFGACAGSFINCAAERYVSKESVFRGRSHCSVCGHVLGVLDLFPIFSYLLLRGRCRHCGAKIPIRCLFTELLGGLVFLSCALKFGFSFFTLEAVLLSSAFLAVALIDLDIMEIPDGILVFCVILFALFLPAYPNPVHRIETGILGAFVLSGGLLILSLIMDKILKKESLGGGDIKFFFVLGLYFGLKIGLLLLILACIIGLVFALFQREKKEFPFGPAISFAAWIVMLFGQDLVDFYLTLFGL